MKNRREDLEGRIRCQLDGPWKGYPQYIFNVDKMEKLDFILKRDFFI
jgi:hypothetical protein